MKNHERHKRFYKYGIAAFALLTLAFLPAFGWASGRDQCFSPEDAEASLQAILDHALSQPNIVNSVMLVQSPKDDFFWAGAGGIANPETGELMTAGHQFRIASITKMMTAVVVLQLIEERYFSLDTKLGHLLDNTDMPSGYDVNDLSIVGDRHYGRAITIRQLLNHTAGLRDYVFDSATATGFASDSLAAAVLADILGLKPTGISHKQWSPQEILAWYYDNELAANALFPPGRNYHYSETGYVLLGIIVQKVTHIDLATQYRQRIFAPLAMTRSYLEWYEPAWGEGPVHHFMDLTPLGFPVNIDAVAAGVNTSFDWAGGGVVSTAKELNRFLRALFRGKLFRHRSTLATMLRGVKVGPQERYGLGVAKIRVGRTWFLGHNGAWGTEAVYVADDGMTIVLALNQWLFAVDTAVYRNAIALAVAAARHPCRRPHAEPQEQDFDLAR